MNQPSPDFLTICPLFGGLNGECCEHFSSRLKKVTLKPGEVVYEEGEAAHELYVVGEGRLEVIKPSLSADVALTELAPGDFFGDMSFIDMQPRSATVRAALPSLIWQLDYSVLRDAYQSDIKCYTLVVMNIAREMSRRLRRADRAWTPAMGARHYGHGS